MSYRYQLHAHTAPCSHCATMTPEELCRALAEGGYAGTVLTNHFMHGNTGIDRSLPWEEFIAPYVEDLRACRAAAEAYDLDILFGIEEGVGLGREVLCYGLTPEVLLRHPELREGGLPLLSQALRAEGVLVVQAHPYREAPYILSPTPLPTEHLDGVEIHNHINQPAENAKAVAFAKAHPGLLTTSGADTHAPHTVPFGGIECACRIRTEAELAALLRSREYRLILS